MIQHSPSSLVVKRKTGRFRDAHFTGLKKRLASCCCLFFNSLPIVFNRYFIEVSIEIPADHNPRVFSFIELHID
jgi:hypothetical protein